MARPPNVLFIISDQHNAKCLGTAGHPLVRTPNLDRLAAAGVRFPNTITQSPICTPSRVSFFTGLYVHNHGYYGLAGKCVHGSAPTVLGHFRAHGYRCASIGKVHCPEGLVRDDCDVYLGMETETDYPEGTRFSAYDEYLAGKDLLQFRDDIAFPEQSDTTRQAKDARCSRLSYEDSVEGCAPSPARPL